MEKIRLTLLGMGGYVTVLVQIYVYIYIYMQYTHYILIHAGKYIHALLTCLVIDKLTDLLPYSLKGIHTCTTYHNVSFSASLKLFQ